MAEFVHHNNTTSSRITTEESWLQSTLKPPSLAKDQSLGFEEVYRGSQANIDIIAIHGLNGHRHRTWTARNHVFWLKDLLPEALPKARILTYGHDAKTHGSGAMTTQYLYDHAISFVSQLCILRRDTNSTERPIVFLAHSLGGLIIKSAMIHSSMCGTNQLEAHRSIATSTHGIIFFGTPHLGTDVANWAKVILDIGSVFASFNTKVIRHLKANSEWLRQQMQQFSSISSSFEIKYCFETYKTPIAFGRHKMIVPMSSASFVGEPNVESIALMKNHITMVQYEDAEDRDFVTVSSTIRDMETKALEAIPMKWSALSTTELWQPETISLQSGITICSRWRKPFTNPPSPRPLNSESTFQLPFSVPQKTIYFTGRASELAQMDSYFRQEFPTAIFGRILVLYGLGGMGKTQLALAYAQQHSKDFSAVLWINGAEERSIQLGLRDCLQRYIDKRLMSTESEMIGISPIVSTFRLGDLLGEDGRLTLDEGRLEDIATATISLLDRDDNPNWLLILDNVDVLSGSTISKYLPRSQTRKIIITSRLTNFIHLGYGIEVGEIDRTAATTILLDNARFRIKSERDLFHASEIVKALGYMPLALEQAGAFISDNQILLAKYTNLYQQHRRELLNYTPSLHSTLKETVLTIWELSFRHVENSNASAAELLLLACFLNISDLWEGIFKFLRPQSNNYEYLELPELRWLSDLLQHKLTFRAAFTKLLAVSLMKRGKQPDGLILHPLVHTWGRERLDTDCRKNRLRQAMVLLHNALVHVSHYPASSEKWLLRHRLRPHMDAVLCFTRAEENLFTNFCCDTIATHALLAFAKSYMELGCTGEAESICRELLRARKTPTPELDFDIRKVLADTLSAASKLDESEHIYRSWLQDNLQRVGQRHLHSLSMILGLGCVLERATRLDESLKYLLMAQKIAPDVPEVHLEDINRSIAQHLLMVYWGKGMLKDAESYVNDILLDTELRSGTEDIEYSKIKYRLGIIHHEMGRWGLAEEVFDGVYHKMRRTFGEEHPETLRLMNAVGRERMFLARYKEGEEILQKALDISEKLLGPVHLTTLRTMSNLGELYRRQSLVKEAEEYLDRSILLMSSSYGEGQREALSIKADKGLLLLDMDRFQEGLELLLKVKTLQKKAFDEGLSDTFRTSRGIGEAYTSLNRYEDAEAEFEELIPTAKKVWGESHPKFMVILISLGRLYIFQTRYREALSLLQPLAMKLIATIGNQHPYSLEAQAWAAEALFLSTENKLKAQEMWEKSFEGMVSVLGKLHKKSVDLGERISTTTGRNPFSTCVS